MADYYDDDYAGDEGPVAGFRARMAYRFSVWSGALCAVMIVGGLAWWGYGLTQRNVTAIPVIRAALGPVKVQPKPVVNEAAPKEPITSYNAGKAPAQSSKAPSGEPVIAFAPPPERPAAEDVPMGQLDSGGASPSVPLKPTLQEPASAPATPDAPASASTSTLAPVSSPPVLSRPGDLAQQVAKAQVVDTRAQKLASAAAASAVQIQLGAFTERAKTESEWQRIYKANEDILHDHALVVQSTISGGQRFFRLRVGPFNSRIEAQNVCRALQARKLDCVVAVNN